MFIVDAHEDIAWNALTFGRNFTQSALAIRAAEADKLRPCGDTMLGRAEWLVGHVGIVFGTLFVTPERRKWGEWDSLCYRDARHAYQLAGAQLDYYHRLADENEWAMLVGDRTALDEVVATWEEGKELADRRVGFVPLMEGADPILEPAQAEEWYARGLRIVGLAWAQTRYAGSSSEPGPLTPEGEELLATMAGLGMILDLSHSAEEACYQPRQSAPLYAVAAWPFRRDDRHAGRAGRRRGDCAVQPLSEAGVAQERREGARHARRRGGRHRPRLPGGWQRRPCGHRQRPRWGFWRG
jgi:membrane dipeptidase